MRPFERNRARIQVYAKRIGSGGDEVPLIQFLFSSHLQSQFTPSAESIPAITPITYLQNKKEML